MANVVIGDQLVIKYPSGVECEKFADDNAMRESEARQVLRARALWNALDGPHGLDPKVLNAVLKEIIEPDTLI